MGGGGKCGWFVFGKVSMAADWNVVCDDRKRRSRKFLAPLGLNGNGPLIFAIKVLQYELLLWFTAGRGAVTARRGS